MRKLPSILLFILLALSQGCVSDNPQFDRIFRSLPSFMLQMGQTTLPAGGNSDYLDGCRTIAIDPQDEGIYCAGRTASDFVEVNGDPTRATPDAILVKFDRNKNLLWAKHFGNTSFAGENGARDIFSGIAFDSKGFVYVGGTSNQRALVAKFHRKGELIWRKFISGSGFCRDIGIRNDRIFCGGQDFTSGFAQAYEIDQNGNMLWLRETSGGTDDILSLDFDRSGNLILAGNTSSSLYAGHSTASPDGFVWKVSPTGQELWIQKIGTESHDEVVNAVSVDINGDIVIGGYFKGSGDAFPIDDDFDPDVVNQVILNSFVAKYRDTGTGLSNLWNIRTNHNRSNYVSALTISPQNEIIIGGITKGSQFEAEAEALTEDIYIGKVQSSGEEILTRQFGANSRGKFDNSGDQLCYSIALDPLGNILCGGTTNGSTEEAQGGNGDIMLWRVGPNLEF